MQPMCSCSLWYRPGNSLLQFQQAEQMLNGIRPLQAACNYVLQC